MFMWSIVEPKRVQVECRSEIRAEQPYLHMEYVLLALHSTIAQKAGP